MSRPKPIPPQRADEAPPTAVVPGLPLEGEKAAEVLGLMLTGQWTKHTRQSLAARWGVTPEAVDKVSDRVGSLLKALTADEPTKRLVMHQLLLALRELDGVKDDAKRIALRVKVCAEIAKVTGLVKGNAFQLPSLPAPLSDQLLEGTPTS